MRNFVHLRCCRNGQRRSRRRGNHEWKYVDNVGLSFCIVPNFRLMRRIYYLRGRGNWRSRWWRISISTREPHFLDCADLIPFGTQLNGVCLSKYHKLRGRRYQLRLDARTSLARLTTDPLGQAKPTSPPMPSTSSASRARVPTTALLWETAATPALGRRLWQPRPVDCPGPASHHLRESANCTRSRVRPPSTASLWESTPFLHTANVGRTWNSQAIPSNVIGLTGISCVSPSQCIAVGFGIFSSPSHHHHH